MSSENKKREQAIELLRAIGDIDDRFLMEAMTAEEAAALSGSPQEASTNAEPAQTDPGSRNTAAHEQETSGSRKPRRSRLRRYSTWALTAAACLTVVIIGRYVSVSSITESTDTKAPVSVQERLTEEQGKDRDAVTAGGAMNSAVAGEEKAKAAQAADEAPEDAVNAVEEADEAPEDAMNAAEEADDAQEAVVSVAAEAADEAALDDAAVPVQDAADEEAQVYQEEVQAVQDDAQAAEAPEQPMTAKGAQAAGAGAALTMPNPFIDTKTLEEAEEAAGFSITLPEVTEDGGTVLYRAMQGQMIEVIFLDENQRELYRIRKGKNLEDDISGVINETAESETVASDDLKITVVGAQKDKWEYAVWTEDAQDGAHYSYSIYADNTALSAEDFLHMAEEMM